jgi:hypothetical protein
MFLMQQHDLKFHKLRALLSLLPSIQRLELITLRLTLVGFMLLTIGLVTGAQLPRPAGDHYLSDPKVLWSALLWLVYLELIVAHCFLAVPRRNFALGVVITFVFLLLTFWHHQPFFAPAQSMSVVVIGLSHRTSPVELRERFAFADEKIPGALAALRESELPAKRPSFRPATAWKFTPQRRWHRKPRSRN